MLLLTLTQVDFPPGWRRLPSQLQGPSGKRGYFPLGIHMALHPRSRRRTRRLCGRWKIGRRLATFRIVLRIQPREFA